MKDIKDLTIPEGLRYTDEHEWAAPGDAVKIGISDYAQDQLGDIVFVELPEVGATFAKGEECGTLESVKAVSEMYMPIAGEIVSVNESLEDEPGLVNTDPYGEGWMFAVKPADPADLEALMDTGGYLDMLKGTD